MAQGAFDDAVARLREGLAGRLGAMFAPYGRARLAEALTRQSKHEAALATVKEALEEQERTGSDGGSRSSSRRRRSAAGPQPHRRSPKRARSGTAHRAKPTGEVL